MSKNSINEVEYKAKVESLYNGEIEVVSRFISLAKPILVKDKYGIMSLPKASQVLLNRPTIKAALNKTEYFMNQLKEQQPDIAKLITPASEYEAMKKKMLFNTKFGLVSLNPDNLIHGHSPSVRVAINRKEYMRNQLLYLYDNKYDFEILSTDRHEGKCILICPIHGKVEIDNDYIFEGCGCIKCNTNWEKSNTLYIVKLTNSTECFYKLGITYMKNNEPRRYRDYRKLGYEIEQIYVKTFDTYQECFDKEFELKQLIKPYLYQPKVWSNCSTTECFTKDLLQIVIDDL